MAEYSVVLRQDVASLVAKVRCNLFSEGISRSLVDGLYDLVPHPYLESILSTPDVTDEYVCDRLLAYRKLSSKEVASAELDRWAQVACYALGSEAQVDAAIDMLEQVLGSSVRWGCSVCELARDGSLSARLARSNGWSVV